MIVKWLEMLANLICSPLTNTSWLFHGWDIIVCQTKLLCSPTRLCETVYLWHCEWETFVKHIASCWHSSLLAERSCTAVDMYLNIIIINMCCRYVDYICRMVSEEPTLPHCHQVMLSSLTMSPVPLVNRTRCVSIIIIITRNTFYGTRYLSHCCDLFCIKTFFL